MQSELIWDLIFLKRATERLEYTTCSKGLSMTICLGFPVSHVFLVSQNTKLNEIHHQFREISHVSRINIFREISFRFVSFRFVTSKISFRFAIFHLVSFRFAKFYLVSFCFADIQTVSFHVVNIFPSLILTKSIKKQYRIDLIFFTYKA
jgi:hypothetical protein